MRQGTPRKRFGQHFLVDRRAIGRILDAATIDSESVVIEIGPGRGALTAGLVERAGRLAAVEVDRDLARALRERFEEPRLSLVDADILSTPLADIAARLDAADSTGLVVVGNLPYNISKPIAMKLFEERARVARAVLMFQREVARRLTAIPGTRDYGPLTVLCGRAYEIETVFDLPPTAFRPAPKVHSTVTRWKRRPETPTPRAARNLRACLGVCFARRRQTLRRNLRAAIGDPERVEALLAALGIDGTARAETLAPSEFVALAAKWDEIEL